MQLGFHCATTMPLDLISDIKVSAQAGFSALELWAAKLHRFLTNHSVSELTALLRHYEITPLAINSVEFIAFRGSDYSTILVRCEDLSRIGQAIGCFTIVVTPSPIPHRDTTWEHIVGEHVRVLRDLSDVAGQYGARLAFEPLGFGWCSVRTVRGAWEIVQRVDRDNVGLVIDCAHVYAGGGLLSEIEALDPARIYAFHLNDVEDLPKEAITDATRVLPGRGVIPLKDICSRLQAIGYDGACSIELFRPEYWQWDPLHLAAEARTTALNVLTPYFEVA